MLWTLFVILLIMWLLGMVTSYTFGGFIHILLVLARRRRDSANYRPPAVVRAIDSMKQIAVNTIRTGMS